MKFGKEELAIFKKAMDILGEGFSDLPEFKQEVDEERLEAVLLEVASKMQDNYPYHHPMYAGQMLKPPHPVARLAYMLSLYVNPNNHALDGGRASSSMEKEAVAKIADMIGFDSHLGHLCGGGTMANLEALWVSSKLHPEKMIVASAQAHYTHERLTDVLGIPFCSIEIDCFGRMNLNQLKEILDTENVGTVVATTGTTAIGSIDPVHEILALREKHNFDFRVHVDAAYGGYFKLVDALDDNGRQAFNSIGAADSVVIDPHKHGLQPYGCGCVLFADPGVGSLYKHDSPYTYFSSSELHLGEISLECSRPGSAAVALWATQKMLPMERDGLFSKQLTRSVEASRELTRRLREYPKFIVPIEPELDIVVFALHSESASRSSRLAKAVFEQAACDGLHLALASLPSVLFQQDGSAVPDSFVWDSDHITCLRTCLMKPDHLDWLELIWSKLIGAVDTVEAVYA